MQDNACDKALSEDRLWRGGSRRPRTFVTEPQGLASWHSCSPWT